MSGLSAFKGERCCVVKAIRPGSKGEVNVNGSLIPAFSKSVVGVGRWAKVIGEKEGIALVAPLNALRIS